MSYWHTPRDQWPSRLEVEIEAAEEQWLDSYEQRLRAWCRNNGHDPESLDATLAYEEWIEEMEQ